jgi:hypothetical protein
MPDRLMERCVQVVSSTLTDPDAIMRVRRAQPTFGRNYTAHFKVDVATLNSNGIDPTNRRCIVVDIPVSNIDSARINPDSQCDSHPDLDPTA